MIETICERYPADWWFPQNPVADYHTGMLAVAICGKCRSQPMCADFGKTEPTGIWGGQVRGLRFDKTCDTCQQERPAIDYPPSSTLLGGRSLTCVGCHPAVAVTHRAVA